MELLKVDDLAGAEKAFKNMKTDIINPEILKMIEEAIENYKKVKGKN